MTLCTPESNKPITLIEEEGKPRKLQSNELVTAQAITLAWTYLQDRGWFNKASYNEDGYKPWFTYPAIDALEDIITRDTKVFEYGSGFSTLYLSQTVDDYTSVEHNEDWAVELKKLKSDLNVSVVKQNAMTLAWVTELVDEFFSLNWQLPRSNNNEHDMMHGLMNKEFAGYASEIGVKLRGYYDLIIVDGMARALTGYLASKYISETGIIILDNSDRWQYNLLQKYLIDSGFGRIDFWGPGTARQDAWCTSFFSKSFKIKNKTPERKIGPEIIFT